MDFANAMISGDTDSCSQANIAPVLPKPVATSSAIMRQLYLVHRSLTFFKNPGGDVRMPAAACTMGSMITAAIIWCCFDKIFSNIFASIGDFIVLNKSGLYFL